MEGVAYYVIVAVAIAAARIAWVIGRTIVERSAVKEALKGTPPERRAEIVHELSHFRASAQRGFTWSDHSAHNGGSEQNAVDDGQTDGNYASGSDQAKQEG
jgi:hypothetical protein